MIGFSVVLGEDSKRIGFLATSSSNKENVPKHTVVIFDKVLNNDGNAYNPRNGIFTAPVDGLYLFSWTVATNAHKNFVTFLEYNGQDVGRNHAGSDGTWNSSASQTLVLHMKKNHKVLLKTYYKGDYIHGGGWSTFTGALIA